MNSVRVIISFLRLCWCKVFQKGKLSFTYAKLFQGSTIRMKNKNSAVKLGKGVTLSNNTELCAFQNGIVDVGDYVYINRNCAIVAKVRISIGFGTTIGPNTIIYDHDHSIGNNEARVSPVTIGKKVWIGGNVVILKGVSIGDNSVIAAGSVVTHDIPANCVFYQKRVNEVKGIEETNGIGEYSPKSN